MSIEESNSLDFCLVCGRPSKGLHFQLACCRACSSFFKRSIELNKVYKCQRSLKNCDLKTKIYGTPLCRYCRLEKCKTLGMTWEKPQSSPTNQSNDSNNSNSQSNHEDVTRNFSFTSFELPEPSGINVLAKDRTKMILDMTSLERKLRGIFTSPSSMTSINLRDSFMSQFSYGFKEIYDADIWPKSPIPVVNFSDKLDHLINQEKFMGAFAKMLVHTKKFRSLCLEDKILLFKHAWPCCYQIERIYTSVLVFGNDPNNFCMMFDDRAVDMGKLEEYRMVNIDEQSYQQVLRFFLPIRDKFVNLMLRPMKTLQLTHFEVSYMFAQILWDAQDIFGLSIDALEMAEECMEEISNDLHMYYVEQLKNPNYAQRLGKMSKMISDVRIINEEKEDFRMMGRIFEKYQLEILGSTVCDSKFMV